MTKCLKLIRLVYSAFGFDKYKWLLSTRPDHFIGEQKEWDQAESELTSALNESVGVGKWELNEGDGAFYGPKIDVKLTDNFGKEHQVATIQLDFQLPQRFKLEYQSDTGSLETPIMIHRAIFGSVERFLAMLIDHYNGKWPFWLSPRQAVIIPVNSSHNEHAKKIKEILSNSAADDDYENLNKFTDYKFFVDIDSRTETVGFRTKDAISKGYNFIILVGEKEIKNGNIAIRSRENRKIENLTTEEVLEKFKSLEDSYI
ncbi:unnamed protein product [Ambrosiozyma monospora]|uniref:Threonyl-tRNA synthetase n=1 Tax=Ambrosiozyma monospora TaxID=43982 RepID=A0A9W7DJA1_AMBMO|nr:unnamed protein product [Ambrosiozyma monospora]